jgi:hypothetical protein
LVFTTSRKVHTTTVVPGKSGKGIVAVALELGPNAWARIVAYDDGKPVGYACMVNGPTGCG